MGLTDNEKMTELSAAIDAVNRGDQPGSQDEEIKELAAVALLLKRSGPPPDVMAGLVDGLSAELAARKRRRRLWLTSGAAGTAAAAILVFALNIGPSAPPQAPLTVPPAGSVVIESVPIPQTAPETAKVSEEVRQPAAPAPKDIAPAAPPAPERPAAVADNRQAEKRAMLARVPEKAAERAADKSAADKTPPATAFLVWPGHEPDSVTVDKSAGTLRQVYGSGEGEIVITQQAGNGAAAAAQDEAKAAGAAEPGGQAFSRAQQKTNKVTVTVKGFAVTVEGSQPAEELQKIARSLQ